jgi:predicted transposase/invertase (TIGR01784 family)
MSNEVVNEVVSEAVSEVLNQEVNEEVSEVLNQEVEVKKKYLPTNDLLFKKAFASEGNEDILRGFINDILGTDFLEVTVKSPYSISEFETEDIGEGKEEKLTEIIRDIFAKTKDGKEICIEMQSNKTRCYVERMMYYLDQAYCGNYKNAEIAGYDNSDCYSSLRPAYIISIMDFDLLPYDCPAVLEYAYVEKNLGVELLGRAGEPLKKIVFFSLTNPNMEKNKKMRCWQQFFRGEELDEDAKEYIKKVQEKVDYQNLTKEEKSVINRLEDTRSQYYGGLAYSKDEGIRIGERRGIQIGETRGIQIGETRGIQIGETRGIQIGETRGIQTTQTNTAKNLIGMGLSDEEIAKGIGISKKEVETMRQTVLKQR